MLKQTIEIMHCTKQLERLNRMGGISHSDLTDKLVGKPGTAKRDMYEKELKLELAKESRKNALKLNS